LKSSSWERIRQDFPATKEYSYLANAAISLIPIQVRDSVLELNNDNMMHGGTLWTKWVDNLERTRDRIANFVGANTEEIAFTHSTSEGMNIVAHMLADRGNVISNDLEYPSSNLPWINKQAEMTIVPSVRGAVPIDDIKNAIEGKTRTIVTSHVQYSTGFRQDLDALNRICSDNNLFFVVNATQSIGALEFNVGRFGIDFMVATGHKWMLSSFGIGILYIKKNLLHEKHGLRPPFFSQFGQKRPEHFDNRTISMSKNASKFELSTPHFPNIVALKAGIGYISKIGILRIEERIRYLTDYLLEKLSGLKIQVLSPLKDQQRSAIILFKCKSPEHLVSYLRRKKVVVSARGGGVRVAPHFYNNERDIDKLISVLKTYF
jgi:cysteine desulfurase/selenocysteine lyase